MKVGCERRGPRFLRKKPNGEVRWVVSCTTIGGGIEKGAARKPRKSSGLGSKRRKSKAPSRRGVKCVRFRISKGRTVCDKYGRRPLKTRKSSARRR